MARASRGEVENAMLVAVTGGYGRSPLAGAAPQLRGTPACESDHGSGAADWHLSSAALSRLGSASPAPLSTSVLQSAGRCFHPSSSLT